MRPQAAAALIVAIVACTGCAGPRALDPGVAAALLANASASSTAPFRERARVRITTDRLRGDFEAVLVAVPGPQPRARLQLFPEVGGKILDVAATPKRITGVMPQAGRSIDATVDEDGAAHAERDVLFFIGATLLERFAPLVPSRVERSDGGALDLAPVFAGVSVTALVDGDGRVHERRYRFRGASWVERDGDRVEIEGHDFQMTIERGAPEPLDPTATPDSLFVIPRPGSASR